MLMLKSASPPALFIIYLQMLIQDSAKRSSTVILIVGLGLMAIGGQPDENELIVQENMK